MGRMGPFEVLTSPRLTQFMTQRSGKCGPRPTNARDSMLMIFVTRCRQIRLFPAKERKGKCRTIVEAFCEAGRRDGRRMRTVQSNCCQPPLLLHRLFLTGPPFTGIFHFSLAPSTLGTLYFVWESHIGSAGGGTGTGS